MHLRAFLAPVTAVLLAASTGCIGYGGSGGSGEFGGFGGSEWEEPPLPGMPCDEPFEIEGPGIAGCLIDHGGLSIKFFPLPEGRRATRLAVYLHGDGAGEWTGNWAFTEIVPWALERDIVVLAPLSPVGYQPGRHDYGAAAQTRTAVTVGSAILDFVDAYGTGSDDLLFWSVSGGSWFTTSTLIPVMGGEIQGLFAISCGASQWWADFTWDELAPSPRDRFRLLFNYGTDDFLAANVERTVVRYEAFDLELKIHDGAQHCAHPIPGPTVEFWENHMQ